MIKVPPEFEPPRHDDDETLPSRIHPSYPLGRPTTLSHPATSSFTRVSLSRARGRQGGQIKNLLSRLGLAPNALRNTRTIWTDRGLQGPHLGGHANPSAMGDAPRYGGRKGVGLASGLGGEAGRDGPGGSNGNAAWGLWAGVLEEEWAEEMPPQMAVSRRSIPLSIDESSSILLSCSNQTLP